MPVVTVLDGDGELIEPDQRALVRHVVQQGYGADIVFSAGTTGEWHRIENRCRQRVIQVCAEEVARINAERAIGAAGRVQSWAGITALTPGETLANLDLAIACEVDAVVLAPLSVGGIEDPVRFVARDVADRMDASSRRIPVYLYDNADIAIDPRRLHIPTKQVKALSRLDFVRGIKVSAPRRVLGHYTKAAASFRERGEFGIYVGDAPLIFDLFAPRRGPFAPIREHWNRHRLSGSLPIGVVAGPANVLPREWARAWQVCRAGDVERMERVQRVLNLFRDGTRFASGKRRTIACLKRALYTAGVISSPAVAAGTPPLTQPDAERFDAALEDVETMSRELIGTPWVTMANQRPRQE